MWARAVPYAEFARLRREAPVAWSARRRGPGFWSVSRYADIVAASRDVATFSSSRGVSFEEPTDEDMAARRTIIDTDPPEHTKLRKIVSGSFSQRAVAVYQHFVEGLTEEVLTTGLAHGEAFDFVDAVAKEVPIRVLAQDHGPARGRPRPVHRPRRPADRQHRPGDHRRGLGPGRHRRLPPVPVPQPVRQAAVGPGPRGRRRTGCASPATTCCPRCCAPRWTATGSARPTWTTSSRSWSSAGNETTRIAIAQGVLAFCEYPEQWDRLRADPEPARDGATEEVLRWSCPTHFMRRTAAADTELGGAAIRAGDKVVLWYVSGNRDEAEFADPDTFDVGRSPNRHLSFGRGGPHLCLGAHLARLEVKVVLAALARRVARFELAGAPRRIRSNFTNGLRELPVRIRPA